jgi:hypothetical protein
MLPHGGHPARGGHPRPTLHEILAADVAGATMKALAGLFALTLSIAIAPTAELEVRIAVVAGKLQALVESATVHSTARAAVILIHRA